MSYVTLDVENLEDATRKIQAVFLKHDSNLASIRSKVNVHLATANKTRKIYAVDSGFNRAYDTPFTVLQAAVVDEEMEVDLVDRIYLFQVDNYQTDRLRRFLMQQILYEALAKTVENKKVDGSIMLIDGTITLTIFYPTLRDTKEYRRHFRSFYEELYTPLMDQCVERGIILLGFLKRTGSNYLTEHLGIKSTYDIYLMNSLLRGDGQFIFPIPVLDANATRARVHYKYVTFYLNLRNWNYRFELLKQQESSYMACIENLLYVATETHSGMNPIFSKADEYARVTKRKANLEFDYLIHHLPEYERTKLRLEARKRTHFNYDLRSSPLMAEMGMRRRIK